MSLKHSDTSFRGVSRRSFITDTIIAGGGLIAASLLPSYLNDAIGAEAGQSLTVACRDAHLKTTGETDCWAALKALGADGVEVVVNDQLACPLLYHPDKKYSIATPAGIEALRKDLSDHQIRITAFCMNNRFDERLEAELAMIKALLPVMDKLKVKAVRLDVVPHAIAKDQFLPFAVSTGKKLCAMAEDTDAHFGIENHGSTTNDPVFLSALFSEVGSQRLGLTLDPNNLYWYGHPLEKVYRIIEQFASRCFHTHCKNIKYPAEKRETQRSIGWEYEKYNIALPDGDIDYHRVLALLRKGNYQGDLCLENECLGHYPQADHPAVLKRETAFLRKLAGA
jgi:sugar phosphate isomerase/epimerase